MKIAVIGGGASGMIAAIVAKRCGADVSIFEHMHRIGKKLLLTGNGKCNISNTDMDISHFHGGNTHNVAAVLADSTPGDTKAFFESIGLFLRDRGGYLYPYSEQASAVLDVLRFAIRDMGIDVYTDTDVKISENAGEFTVSTSSGRISFDRVILCCGSCVARNTGSDGSGYEIARRLGHNIVKPLPALTHLLCEEDFFPSIAGIRINANVRIYKVKDDIDLLLGQEYGQVQLTKTGISGIPVFNLSHMAVRAMDNGVRVKAELDLIPDIQSDEMSGYLKNRRQDLGDRTVEEFFIGLLPKQLGICVCKRVRLAMTDKISSLSDKSIEELCHMIKSFEVYVRGHGDFDWAQVACGGVDMNEVTEKLGSKIVSGLFFAGEILDVNGDCGGYNLQWAASSAMTAAREACSA